MSRDNEDIDRDLAENDDGLRPDEIEGPDASEASPPRCEFRQGERTTGVGEASFEVSDELNESFPIEPIPVVMGPGPDAAELPSPLLHRRLRRPGLRPRLTLPRVRP